MSIPFVDVSGNLDWDWVTERWNYRQDLIIKEARLKLLSAWIWFAHPALHAVLMILILLRTFFLLGFYVYSSKLIDVHGRHDNICE